MIKERGRVSFARLNTQGLHNRGGILRYPDRRDQLVDTLLQDVTAESVTAQYPLGTVLLIDERAYRYCQLGGTAVTKGLVVQTAAAIAGHANRAMAAAAIGATSISYTPNTTNISAGQYDEGYFWVNDAAGEGQISRIQTTPAITAGQAGTITLYEPLTTALTTSSEGSLLVNPWKGLIVSPATTLTGAVKGVTVRDVTANYYFWAQVAGPCAVLTVGTLVAGANAVVPTGTAGGVGPASAATDTVVGRVLVVNATTEYSLIDLRIES